MSNKMTIHGGVRFAGNDPGMEKMELEELAQDPVDVAELGVGRIWINTTEQKIKCVIATDEQELPVVASFPTDTDYSFVLQALQGKADQATTLAGYGITDAASTEDILSVEQTHAEAPGTVGFAKGRDDTVVAFDNATRTFTITPLTQSYRYYVKGKRYERDTAVSVQITDTEGLWFFYFDDAGGLQSSLIPWDLFTTAPIAIVYWNPHLQSAQFIGEERHGSIMDPSTHAYMHHTQGTKYRKGFIAHNYTTEGDGSQNAHAQLGLTDGIIQDEDIVISVVHSATPVANFQQLLNGVGYFPVLYRQLDSWVRENPTSYAVKTGVSRIYHNALNTQSGQWEIQEAPEGSYVAMFLMATNAQVSPVMSIMGQRSDVSLDDAKQNNDFAALNWGNMPFTEFKGLYRLIFQTSSGYGNAAKARLVAVDDLRNIVSVAISAIPTASHSELTGLLEDNHTQYVHTLISRLIRAQHVFDPTSARPAFLLGENAQGQLIPGLNADLLDGMSAGSFQPFSSELVAAALTSGAGLVKRAVNGVWSAAALQASEVPNLSWNKITTDKPTTLAGYGITDAVATNVVKIVSGSVPIMSGTNTNIALTNNTPLITEGVQVFQQTLTPRDALSKFIVEFNGMVDVANKDRAVILTLFRRIGSGAWVFLGYSAVWFTTADAPQILTVLIEDPVQTTETVTYVGRIGLSGNGSWYLGRTRDATMGGTNPSTYRVTEITP